MTALKLKSLKLSLATKEEGFNSLQAEFKSLSEYVNNLELQKADSQKTIEHLQMTLQEYEEHAQLTNKEREERDEEREEEDKRRNEEEAERERAWEEQTQQLSAEREQLVCCHDGAK